jgi:Domain of unknown function (DUF4886)
MTKPNITPFPNVAPLSVQRYEKYLPTAFDDSLNLLQKLNKVIHQLDEIGSISNEVVDQWNTVMEWVMGEGLNDGLVEKLNTLLEDGTIEQLLNVKIVGNIDQKTLDLQEQLNNLVIAGGSVAEVEQARGSFNTLNEREAHHETNISLARLDLLGDLKGILRKGYYDSTTGNLINNVGSNWYHFFIVSGSDKFFVLENPYPVTVRIAQFDDAMTFIGSKSISNGEFSVATTATRFAVNVRLEPSNPTSTTTTAFNAYNDFFNLIIRKEEGIKQRFDKIETSVMNDLTNVQIPIPNTEVWTEYPNELQVGYYNSSGGNYAVGTNWYSFKVDAGRVRRFKVNNSVEGAVRLLMYKDDVFMYSQVIQVNAEFTLPKEATRFNINVQGENASPTSTTTPFTDLNNFSISGYVPLMETKKLVQQVEELKTFIESDSSKTSLKILMIGNSFSQDVCQWLYEIAQQAGVSLTVGTLVIGGQDLAGHLTQVNTNATGYSFYYWSPISGYRNESAKSFNYGLTYDQWDIVTFQQESDKSGLYNTFQPHLNSLIAHTKANATNTSVKIGLHMTWAYATTSDHAGFNNYGKNQITMYNAILDAYLQALKECDIDILLPTGTAIQNARTNPELKAIGQELTRDGHHLDYGIGRYIGGLTVFQTLIGKDSSYVPANGGTKYLTYLSKIAVKNAVLNPFKITSFKG